MAEPRRRRAPAMTPQERRAAIVAATLPLLVEHGAAVTTGQIATASGVAEGTVFRAFADKQELMGACLAAAFDSAGPVAALHAIPRDLPLPERLRRASETVAAHWERAFQVAQAVRCAHPGPGQRDPGPGQRDPGPGQRDPGTGRTGTQADHRGPGHIGAELTALIGALADLLAPDAHRLRLGPDRVAQMFLLAVTGDRMLRHRVLPAPPPAPGPIEELIDVFLHGALKGEHG